MAYRAEVKASQRRHREEDQHSCDSDAQLQERIRAQRVACGGYDMGQSEAAEAHSPHERTKQHGQRNRRRANHKLEHLQPDDLVNESCAAAAHKQKDEPRITARSVGA